MKKTAVFVDYENIRILIGEKFHKDLYKVDFISKLKNKLSKEGYLVNQIFVYDNFLDDNLVKNEYLNIFSGASIIPKHVLHTKNKNSADIELCLDALELTYKTEIDNIVIVSSDKDMFPLIKKLKEKYINVVLIGLTFNASSFVINSCNEFIPIEEVLGIEYDKDHIIKSDLIACIKRIKDLETWSKKKGKELGKDFCISKLKSLLFCDTEYVENLYNKIKDNDLIEEITYKIKSKSYTGVKIKNDKEVEKICLGEKPMFS